MTLMLSLVTDPDSIVHASPDDCTALIKHCHEIVSVGWHVPKWMIDKSRAELKALRQGKVALSTYVWLCV